MASFVCAALQLNQLSLSVRTHNGEPHETFFFWLSVMLPFGLGLIWIEMNIIIDIIKFVQNKGKTFKYASRIGHLNAD